MKKIKAVIGHENSDRGWEEEFDIEDDVNAEEFVSSLVSHFNNTLRPGEQRRKLISVSDTGEKGTQNHKWSKTNVITIRGRNGLYDTVVCDICGITGRRYGIGREVIPDREYRAKCYETCDSTLEHLKRKVRKQK